MHAKNPSNDTPAHNALWPPATPTPRALNNIVQIQYRLKPPYIRSKKVVKVYAVNIWGGAEYERAVIPLGICSDIVAQIVWRQWALSELYQERKQHSSYALKNYLKYFEGILDAIWVEAGRAQLAGQLDEGWLPSILRQWGRLEYYVGRHSPEKVEEWITSWNGESLPELEDVQCLELLERIRRSGFPGYSELREVDWAWDKLPAAKRKEVLIRLENWLLVETRPMDGPSEEEEIQEVDDLIIPDVTMS
ncbi:hypothetical protein AX16_007033 [Volvariella volvacea WC 439]|nr:hypothetical protein AX16_007033 [Volvariella volvacea WC 439]